MKKIATLMQSLAHRMGLSVLLCALSAGPLWAAKNNTEPSEEKRIAVIAEQTITDVQARVKAANKLGYDEREEALDGLLHEVVAPLLHNAATAPDFYGEHWVEIQRLGLHEQARLAALAVLKDNYQFVIERSDRADVELKKVVLNGENEASAFFRITIRKRIPVEVELRSDDQHKWRIHDLILMRRSIRGEVGEELRKAITEKGPQVAFAEILAEQ